MIDRSQGGTSLRQGHSRERGKPLHSMDKAPDWFVELAKVLLFKLEYGQPFADAANKLWAETQKHFDQAERQSGT